MTRAEIEEVLALADQMLDPKHDRESGLLRVGGRAIQDLCRRLIAAEDNVNGAEYDAGLERAEADEQRKMRLEAEAREAVLREALDTVLEAWPWIRGVKSVGDKAEAALASTGSEAADGGDAAFMAAGFRRYGKKFADAIGALRRVR